MAANGAQWASPLLVASCFVALWIVVTWLLSHISGWVALARIYRANREAGLLLLAALILGLWHLG